MATRSANRAKKAMGGVIGDDLHKGHHYFGQAVEELADDVVGTAHQIGGKAEQDGEKTISGSMALRLNSRPTKSSVVKKFTIMSARRRARRWPRWPCRSRAPAPGNQLHDNEHDDGGNGAGDHKSTVVPMILPARSGTRTLATELEMEANTSGTTTQNIILMNTVLTGLIK